MNAAFGGAISYGQNFSFMVNLSKRGDIHIGPLSLGTQQQCGGADAGCTGQSCKPIVTSASTISTRLHATPPSATQPPTVTSS